MDTPATPNIDDRKRADKAAANPQLRILEALGAGELFWQPYRSVSRMLLHTHQNLAAYVQINRALADEMQHILRRAQDMVMQMSEKGLQRAHESAESGDRNAFVSRPAMEEMYDFAIDSVRELGGATVEAHVRSLKALRDQARASMEITGQNKR
ncbi:MAG TPA: hypothetical protein VGI20_06575 [Rhizomicrobium sp.]|jgi:hypothetical protein